MAVDPDEFDLAVTTWACEQAEHKRTAGRTVAPPASDSDEGSEASDEDRGRGLGGTAVDGKTLRGAKRADGTQVQLLSALCHDTGMSIGQRNVDNEKTNEILAFAPLLSEIELTGRVVTADAMHTQTKAATFVVEDTSGHYVFGVKENQPKLWDAAVEVAAAVDLCAAEHETYQRGNGRIDRHRIWTAVVPASITFPHARTYLIVERESSTLDDVRVSIETRFYVTDLTPNDASAEHMLRLVRGHWSIENGLRWVRDVTFDEDRSQVRTGSLPRVLATLRNLAISAIRYATSRTVNIAAATRQLARQPDRTLDLLGISPLACK
jgi:predicted transposase YbfD/YdcC